MAQVEIRAPVSVVDNAGRPSNFGWARSALFQYDPDLVRVPRRRINESDRYIVFSSTHLVVFEVLDSGYLGCVGTSVISTKDKQRTSHLIVVPFSLGGFAMPAKSERGCVRLREKEAVITFAALEKGEKGIRIIKTDIPHFGHQRRLRGELVLFEPAGAQSIVTHTSWRRDRDAFRCVRRSPWYVAEGVVQFGTTELVFTRGNAWGIFEWHRGVRPRMDTRYWASACGVCGGKQIGFSVGYGSEDARAGTENGFFLEGRLHKLDQVTFHISPTDWLRPWHFTSNDNRLEMRFIPYQDRLEHTSRFLFYSHKYLQVCGLFSGTVILDDGSPLSFQNITGFAERRKTRF
ncbi:MAG: DUF2804 domain-containing protein [Spirochaetaceae bacterium]|jgi:hypothetical protein|nr:DUF2804 domain-containing protein [Spirochaetaceae bacterium]